MISGEKIKILRKQRKMTQKQLADIIGVASNTLTMYEKNTRTPSYETLKKLSDFFSVDITYFFEEDTKSADPSAALKNELITTIRGIDNLDTLEILDKMLDIAIKRGKIAKIAKEYEDLGKQMRELGEQLSESAEKDQED